MSTKQVKVHADGCTPDSLELTKYEDTVVFVQGDPAAPTIVYISDKTLFGTSICAVGSSASAATPYTAKAVGNFTLGVTAAAAKASGASGTTQVLCLASTSSALGVTGTGSIKVTG